MTETVATTLVIPRQRARAVPLPNPGVHRPWIASWELVLHAEGKSAKTIRTYTEAVIRLAGWLLDPVWMVDPQALNSRRRPEFTDAMHPAQPAPPSGVTRRERAVPDLMRTGWPKDTNPADNGDPRCVMEVTTRLQARHHAGLDPVQKDILEQIGAAPGQTLRE